MQKNTLASIIFALAIFLFFILVLPQYDAIKAAKEAMAFRRGVLTERTAAFNKVKELDAQAKSRQSDINKIHSFLPERKQIDEVVMSIKEIAETNGMQFLGMTTSEVPSFEAGSYSKLLIGLDLAGQYPAFVNFLKSLEQSLRLYDVSVVNAAASTTVLGSVNFSIKVGAYYLK